MPWLSVTATSSQPSSPARLSASYSDGRSFEPNSSPSELWTSASALPSPLLIRQVMYSHFGTSGPLPSHHLAPLEVRLHFQHRASVGRLQLDRDATQGPGAGSLDGAPTGPDGLGELVD